MQGPGFGLGLMASAMLGMDPWLSCNTLARIGMLQTISLLHQIALHCDRIKWIRCLMSRCTDSPGAVQASNKRRRLKTPQTAPQSKHPVPRSHCETAPPACQPCNKPVAVARCTSPQHLTGISAPSAAIPSASSHLCGISCSAAQPSDMMSMPAAHDVALSRCKHGNSSAGMACDGLDHDAMPIVSGQPQQDAAASASMQQASIHASPASGLNQQQLGLTPGSRDLLPGSSLQHAGVPMSDVQPSQSAAAPSAMQACGTESRPSPGAMQPMSPSAEGPQQQHHAGTSTTSPPSPLQLDPKLPDMRNSQMPPRLCHVPDEAGSSSTVPRNIVPEPAGCTITCKSDQQNVGVVPNPVVRLVRPPRQVNTPGSASWLDAVKHADAPIPPVASAAQPVEPVRQHVPGSPWLVSERRSNPCGEHQSETSHQQAMPAAIAAAGVVSPQRRRVAPEADKENSTPSTAKPSRPPPGLTRRNSHAKMVLAAFNASHGAAPHQTMTSPKQGTRGPAPLPCSPPANEDHVPAPGQLPSPDGLRLQHSSRADAHAPGGSPNHAACVALSPSMGQHALNSHIAAGRAGSTAGQGMLALPARSPSGKQESTVTSNSKKPASVSLLSIKSPDARLPAVPATAGGLAMLLMHESAEAQLKFAGLISHTHCTQFKP